MSFLNGERLARHEGGGQPFSLDVTGKLLETGNILAIRIVRLPNYRPKPNDKGFEEIFYVHSRHPKAPDNWPYGGIPRTVSLVTENLHTLRKVQTRTADPGKPLIIMENGAWSPLGNPGPADKRNTEDWQADLLRRQHEVFEKIAPPLAGFTYWLLVDYRSRKEYTGKQTANGHSRMGLYNEFGKPKLARDTFRDLAWPVR